VTQLSGINPAIPETRESGARLGHFESLRLTVRNQCMAPLLCDGDTVQTERGKHYYPGDVVVVPRRGQLAIHRLLGYRRYQGNWCAVTAGDHSPSLDDPTPMNTILGKVIAGGRPEASRIPTLHRVQATGRYLSFGLRALFRRTARK